MDQLLSDYIDANEAICRGDYCPGCGAAWHTEERETMGRDLMPSRGWVLRHELECPYRRGFAEANLGRLVGELLQELGRLTDFLDDPITVHYGVGSEMTPLVWRGIQRRCHLILDCYGVTVDELGQMIDERCSPKWTYESGLNLLRDED